MFTHLEFQLRLSARELMPHILQMLAQYSINFEDYYMGEKVNDFFLQDEIHARLSPSTDSANNDGLYPSGVSSGDRSAPPSLQSPQGSFGSFRSPKMSPKMSTTSSPKARHGGSSGGLILNRISGAASMLKSKIKSKISFNSDDDENDVEQMASVSADSPSASATAAVTQGGCAPASASATAKSKSSKGDGGSSTPEELPDLEPAPVKSSNSETPSGNVPLTDGARSRSTDPDMASSNLENVSKTEHGEQS